MANALDTKFNLGWPGFSNHDQKWRDARFGVLYLWEYGFWP